jgi:hypothetical protein
MDRDTLIILSGVGLAFLVFAVTLYFRTGLF